MIMKRYLIIINGIGGSGKSEFIKQCKLVAPYFAQKIEVRECSTVDYVKKIAVLCGWESTKNSEDRIFLSDLKQALEKWHDIPYQRTIDGIISSWTAMEESECEYGVVFLNSREPKDIERFIDAAPLYDAISVKVYISNNKIKVNEVPTLIDGIKNSVNNCDYHIENNGTLFQLFISAAYFMQDLLGMELKNEELEENR